MGITYGGYSPIPVIRLHSVRVAGPELPRRVTLTAMTTAMRTVLPSIDGDYLGLEGSECPVDVIDALGDVLGPRSAGNQDGFLIRHEGLCVEVVLNDAPDTDPVSDTGTPTARLAIADLPGDRLARRGVPALLYQKRVANTRCSLRWSSDQPSTGTLTGATTARVLLPEAREDSPAR